MALPSRYIYIPSFKNDISKHVQKVQKTFRWLGALLTPLSEFFCLPEGQKLPNHDNNHQRGRHLLYKCVCQIWGLYIIFEAMDAKKWLWFIFGCKVGQNVLIEMKLECGMWHHLPNVHIKSQMDFLKHLEKIQEEFEKPKNTQKIAKIAKKDFCKKRKLCRAGHLCTKFGEFILIYEAMVAKNEFDLHMAVNYDKVIQLWRNSKSTCRATYQVSIWYLKAYWKPFRKTRTDGRMDRRTDIATA